MVRRLRIVRVLPFWHPRYGGSVTHARRMTQKLAERGHEIRVVTSNLGFEGERPVDRWFEEGPYLVRMVRTWPWQRVPPYGMKATRRPMLGAMSGADLVLSNLGLTLLGDYVRSAAKKAKVPYVYSAEGALCPVRLEVKARRKKFFLPLVEHRVLGAAEALHAMNEKERDDYLEQGARENRIFMVPNGIELADRIHSTERYEAREALGLTDERVLLYLGRVTPLKGLDLLIQGMSYALWNDLVLLVAGPCDPGERERIVSLATTCGLMAGDRPRVRFLGLVDDEGRRRAFAASDVFCLTSRSEGLPVAPLEAAAAGLPLLVTDACHLQAVTDDGGGVTIEPEPSPIRDALTWIFAERGRAAWMGARARSSVAVHHSLDTVADRLEAIYLHVVQGSFGQ
ncbi:MAG: glycosyltransferase [Planctomycetes bacterium]|nr:glycosyltransferase [Planctomycetota bacterium]MCB9919038.1 glycosyltransferase [Planctomycetota bacterium]